MPSIILSVEVGHPDPKMLPASSSHKKWQDPGSSHFENRSSSSYGQGRLTKDWGKCAKHNPKASDLEEGSVDSLTLPFLFHNPTPSCFTPHPTLVVPTKIIRVDKFEQRCHRLWFSTEQASDFAIQSDPGKNPSHSLKARFSLQNVSFHNNWIIFAISSSLAIFPDEFATAFKNVHNGKLHYWGERWKVRDIVDASLIQTPDIQSWSQGQRKGNGLLTGTHKGLYGFPGPHRRHAKLTW